MTRIPLPSRRDNCTVVVPHPRMVFTATFGFHDGRDAEVFCDSPRAGSDSQAVVRDASILMSLLLQHGATMHEVAAALAMDRPEGAKSGPPSSPLGAIARIGAELVP